MRLLYFFLCFYVFVNVAQSQIVDVSGTYRGLSAQGMAIFKDNAYLLNSTGYCRVFNLRKKTIISIFRLGSYSNTNHANCASFGYAVKGQKKKPVMYVSECSHPWRCFVEHITDSASSLVQTIQATIEGKPEIVHDWVIDNKNHYLYGIRTAKNKNDSLCKYVNTFMKYRLSAKRNIRIAEQTKSNNT